MPELVSLVHASQAIQSLRDSDFDTCSAVGEVIDNSLQAEATVIHLRVKERELPAKGRRPDGVKEISEIAFGDNGTGMDKDTLHRCMQLGFSTRYNDRSGIGRFGVGMTLGAINQCSRIEVWSKEKSSKKWLHTLVDLDDAAKDPHIPAPKEADLPAAYKGLVSKEHGTLVLWSKFDRSPQTLDEVSHWISRTYRKFIGKFSVKDGKLVKNANPVVIKVNDAELEAFDPLYAVPSKLYPGGEASELYEPIEFELPVPHDAKGKDRVSKIRIQMSFTPPDWRQDGGGKSSRSLPEELRINENEGFSILRAGREVFYDIMPHFKPAVDADGVDRWWSAEIQFDPVLDRYFNTRNIKRGATFTPDLRLKIQDYMKATILECRKQVKTLWQKNKSQAVVNGVDVTTEHTEAEKVVKTVNPSPGKAGADKSQEELQKERTKILEEVIKKPEDLAAWVAKIESQPCTVIDNEGTHWKGATFIDIHPQGGKTIIEYNRQHEFFTFVYGIIKQLEGGDGPVSAEDAVALAKKLKTAIDLLFMAYAQAENAPEHDHEQRIGDTLDILRNSWGTFLLQYVRTLQRQR
jgi:hypothetical protein